MEPAIGELLVKLWDKLPSHPARHVHSPQGSKMPLKFAPQQQQQGYQGYQGQGYRSFPGQRSDLRSSGSSDESQGHDPRGHHRGGRGGYSHGYAGYSQPMGMHPPPPHMGGQGFGPMYPGPPIGSAHHQMGGGFGGQNPVMILQRGQGGHPQARSGGAQYYKSGK